MAVCCSSHSDCFYVVYVYFPVIIITVDHCYYTRVPCHRVQLFVSVLRVCTMNVCMYGERIEQTSHIN